MICRLIRLEREYEARIEERHVDLMYTLAHSNSHLRYREDVTTSDVIEWLDSSEESDPLPSHDVDG